MYGAIVLMYGAMVPMYGAMVPMYGAMVPMYGAMVPMYGAMVLMYGAMVLMYGAMVSSEFGLRNVDNLSANLSFASREALNSSRLFSLHLTQHPLTPYTPLPFIQQTLNISTKGT